MTRTELRWLVSFSSSCLHAADAIAQGWELVDPRLAEPLWMPAIALRDEILAAHLPAPRVWQVLTAFAHQIENNRELAVMSLRKTIGWAAQHEALAQRLAAWIAALENAALQAVPQMVDELSLRSGPIRQLWEACGPGLLRHVGELTDERLIVENADVVLVQPVLGGAGAAHLMNNSVRLEAVLTNNVAGLPEVVRLAWLVAQLHVDAPLFSEKIVADRLPRIASLALLPAVLQAASELELCRIEPATLAQAIDAWRIDREHADTTAEIVGLWWETYCTSPTAWATAMMALDQMLCRSCSA
jgi:hypothetical protein